MTGLIERAPAKVNLTLHVRGRRSDGLHALESLVGFSGSGDVVSLIPADELYVSTAGPFSGAIGPAEDNLVARAAENLAREISPLRSGHFHLTKNLPAASGIGGGSSDAAAALRLLARLNDLALDDRRILRAAAKTGADVPVCLLARTRMMRGAGEELGGLLRLPPLFAVLVNPGVELATGAVFAGLGLAPGEDGLTLGAHPEIAACETADELFAALRRARNDLEPAACVLAPVINDVLAVLAAARGCRLARMSGSGATCFALFATRAAASRAARNIRRTRPQWWVKACVLR